MKGIRQYMMERIRDGMCQEDAWKKKDNIYDFREEIDAFSNFDLLEYIDGYIEENNNQPEGDKS